MLTRFEQPASAPLPAYLATRDGKTFELIGTPDASNILALVASLPEAQKTVFAEHLVTCALGRTEDHYEGWNLCPTDVLEVVCADWFTYLRAYLLTTNQWDDAIWALRPSHSNAR